MHIQLLAKYGPDCGVSSSSACMAASGVLLVAALILLALGARAVFQADIRGCSHVR